uniref:Uncharacterized protein n=1 Tax=Onchocerca volvulus TaxID=6282 RepID=A0A8R1TWQ4_ONCVO
MKQSQRVVFARRECARKVAEALPQSISVSFPNIILEPSQQKKKKEKEKKNVNVNKECASSYALKIEFDEKAFVIVGSAIDAKNECIVFRYVFRNSCNKPENSKNQAMGKESSSRGVVGRGVINLENVESSHCASFSSLIILFHLTIS